MDDPDDEHARDPTAGLNAAKARGQSSLNSFRAQMAIWREELAATAGLGGGGAADLETRPPRQAPPFPRAASRAQRSLRPGSS